MTNDRRRKTEITACIIWIILLIFDAVSIPFLYLRGMLSGMELAAMIVLSVLFWAGGLFLVIRTYRNHIKPAGSDEKTGQTDRERYLQKIHKRRKGRDMFEVCDNYRRSYFVTLFIILGIVLLILPFMFILKFNEYDNLHIPVWVAFPISALVMGISIFASRKMDLVFCSSTHLRFEIRKNGLDEFYVNTDFMMATYHNLLKGFMAIGQSYYVIFMQKFCYVGEMNKVTKAVRYSREYKLNGTRITRYFVMISEQGGASCRFACAGEISADMIIAEFASAGIETEVLPVERDPHR